MTESQLHEFNATYSNSDKRLPSFKEQLYQRLNGKIFGNRFVFLQRGKKSLKFNENNTLPEFVAVDIVPAFEYRCYRINSGFRKENQVEGIQIYDSEKEEYIINYPKLHRKHGEEKNNETRTNGNYKETVRVFKQIKAHLVELGVIRDELISSYGLECMLYNVPDSLFKLSIVDRVDRIIEWLGKNINGGFKEQSEMYDLFMRSLDIKDAKLFLEKCKWLSDNWR